MEALTSFVVNSQPLVVPALPQDPPSAVVTSQPSSMETPPLTQVEHEIVVPPSGHVIDSQPKSAHLPVELQIEDISPAPSLRPSILVSSHDDASTFEGESSRRDPFVSSALEGFALQSVGSTLGPRPSAASPSPREEYLWLILRTGATDGQRPRKVQKDKTEKLYKQESGLFAPPAWPASLPVFNRVAEEDRSLRDLQAQWGMVGLALSRAINHLEAVIGPVMISADPENPGSSLKDELDSLVATPLAHALRLVGANFNELSTKRRRRLLKGIRDPQLFKWLEDSKESVSSLFHGDVSAALEAARARRTDGLISMASKAARPPTSSISAPRGRRFEPYPSQRQPFRGGRSRFNGRGRLSHLSSTRGRGGASSSSDSTFSRETSI